jgi:outer membrane protein assembly factor BamD (BamD/ComL family)
MSLESGGRRVRRARAFVLFVLALAASAGAAWGCGWGGFDNSVRFGVNSEVWRTRLPPLPTDSGVAADVDEEVVSYHQRAADTDALWDDAGEAVASGDLGEARRLLKLYVGRTAAPACDEGWSVPADCRARRNSALDRLDALAALERGSSHAAVRSYLEARDAYDERQRDGSSSTSSTLSADKDGAAGDRQTEVEARLVASERDPNLADNVAYLRAVGVYLAWAEGDAYEAFESVARLHPRGEKREAALFMAGRLGLESSQLYLDGEPATSQKQCIPFTCRDEGFERAQKNFKRLLKDYPRGRYAADARGWLAYLDYRTGDTAGALAGYYRMLADGEDAGGRSQAATSLRFVRPRASAEDLDALERELEDEPGAALAYAYHSVYNYAAGDDLLVPQVADHNPYGSDYDSTDGQRWEERKEASLRTRAENAELRRAADFASRMVARHPAAQVGGAFLVRLAGAQLQLGQPKPALEAARRALASGVSGEERARALWAEGVAEYYLKDYGRARRSLGLAVEASPRSALARRARELMAVAAEEAGDLAGALEQYLALGYDPDVAYFVDVLMTPEQLSSFVEKNDASPRRDELLYALGLRLMRAGRYREARAALSRVRTAADSYNLSSEDYEYYDTDSETGPGHPKEHFRHSFWDVDSETYSVPDAGVGARAVAASGRDTRVYADWLLRDMQTLSDLERLQGYVEGARGDEEKAEALYQLASYFYEGELLFYNPAAWRGMRGQMINSLGESSYRAPAEAQTVWDYVREHEGPARALVIYLDVVRLYPRTRAARDSLYTAVLCHERLANYNGYWREMYQERRQHAGQKMVTLADLRREYPNYRLPVAGRWKPSTRTVSGAPAWPAPPRSKRLNGVERARMKLKRAELRVAEAWELFGEVYEGRVRRWALKALRWSCVGTVALLVLGLFRRTRRARRFLYRRLLRHLRRRPPVYAPSSSYAAHYARAPFAELGATVARAAGGLLRLALHERGRAALALNLFTHALLTMLLWAVLWAARG